MISYRPWRSASLSSAQSSPTAEPSESDLGGTVAHANPSKRSSALCLIPVVTLILGAYLLILKPPESYGDNNGAAICAIQKGAVRYLDEWVQYHLLAVGFEDIYLYDNSEDFELEAWHQSYDPKLRQRIHIHHFPGLRQQNNAYTYCAKQIQQARFHAWIAFIDIDEFLVLRDIQRYPYISDFLKSLPSEYGGLAVNWVVFHLNNQMHYEDLPVTLRFQNRAEDATNQHIKTIARTQFFRKALNPHYVGYLLFRWWIRTHDTRGNIVDGPFNPELADEQIAIYHYSSKSLEEYKTRCSRGRPTVSKKEMAKHLSCQSDEEILLNLQKVPETIKDDAPWQLLKERVPIYVNTYMAS